ncbi:MAG: helix-turn-helix domain-containing protein [Deltaproteobacteria bacterium]|nr:helix-turn-helix domain-containing protein [Deltaproteobacteria bacterium]
MSRTTVYRLRDSGKLRPDGYVGRSPRFDRESLDAFVRGSVSADSTERSAELEAKYANQAKPVAKADRSSGNSTGRTRSIRRSGAMAGSPYGDKKEQTQGVQHAGRSRGLQGGPRSGGTGRTHADEVRRLRDAVASAKPG